MPKPILVAASGQAGSGKDQFCNYLCDTLNDIYDNTWFRGSFASNVKSIFCKTFGVDLDFIERWKRTDDIPPGFQMPVRKALTFIGDGFRDIQESIWIESLLRNNERNLAISDCRYVNESKYIRSHNGITILLWRPGYENDIQNRSEQELMQFVRDLKDIPDCTLEDEDIPFDIWIRNEGTLDDLFVKIDNIVVPYIKELYEH